MSQVKQTGMLAVAALILGFIPLFGWVASVLIGVATFELGSVAAGIVTVSAAIPYVMHGMTGDVTAYWGILFSCLYVWLMAEILKVTSSWSSVLNLTAVLGLIIVNALHFVANDIYAWWYHYFLAQLKVISGLLNQIGLQTSTLSELIGINLSAVQSIWTNVMDMLIQRGIIMSWTQFMTGLVITGAMIGNLFNLWVARWWHERKLGKNDSAKELCFIRLHWLLVVIAVLALLLFKVTPIAKDNFTVIGLVLMIGGLSLIHWFALQQKWLIIGLIIFYIVLVLTAKPVLLFVTFLAMIDALLNVRKNFGKLCHVNERGK